MRKIVMALALVASTVALPSASEKSTERFNVIRSHVARLDAPTFEKFVSNELKSVEETFKVNSVVGLRYKAELEKMAGEFATLAEFASRSLVVKTFRARSIGGYAPEAFVVADTIFVNEGFLEKIFESLGGKAVLEAVVAHELSHGRDFLVKRAVANDKSLSAKEKDEINLAIEVGADRGALDALMRLGRDPNTFIRMLERFNEASRLREARELLKSVSVTSSRSGGGK